MEMLDPHLVLGAYAAGVFPMADSRDADTVFWVEPRQRAILPLDGFRVSRSLRKTIASDRFRVTADTAFADVLALCAESVANRPDTWISRPIERVFAELHRMGFAHSIECWSGDRLIGGLYGLALGRAFFGESMVSRATDASKVALAWLVARLKRGGFTLLDCQFQTDHLASLGAIEIAREDYLALLTAALGELAGAAGAAGAGAAAGNAATAAFAAAVSSPSLPDFGALDALGGPDPNDPAETVSGPVSGRDILQLLVHTS
ncbi:MAG TPA: leucyl/phenylalanyl-tRNA--protein transferase [Sphingomonas sp.]|nr:leucyl/phenylalanyl-tRNA--protein transferase [Sphingomonas sp.]